MLVVLVPVGTPSSAEWHWDMEEEVLWWNGGQIQVTLKSNEMYNRAYMHV